MRMKRLVASAASLALAVTLIAGIGSASWGAKTAHAATPSGALANAFATAAQHYGVPQQLLMSVSYAETHWNTRLASNGANGEDGASESVYGPMALYLEPDGTGTIAQAASDLGVSVAQVENDPATNILGAAAVLSDDSAATNNGKKPSSSDVNQWYGAVAKYVGGDLYEPTKEFADNVFALLQNGVADQATDGERLSIAAQTVNPNTSQINVLNLSHLQPGPSDYPGATWIPSGGKHYGAANRPDKGLFIQYIVIHDTEEDYPGTVRSFRNPGGCCSANYVVDGEAGGAYPTVTQFVHNKDISYHAGNYWFNQHSIGIEHVGFADAPNGYYTQKLYDASAQLVAYLCAVYNIPIDRAHILGHGSVPGPSQVYVNGMHWDPGPFWDWAYYLNQVRYYYSQWTSSPLPTSATPTQYQTPRSAVRTVAVNATHDAASDITNWSGGTYVNFANVTTTPGGSTLVRGASDPNSWVSPSDYVASDFSCDNLPDATQNGNGIWTEDTNSDLRAKAEYQQAFALIAQTSVGGVTYDEINFNGVPGWVKDSETADGWGAIVTFSGAMTLYGRPTLSSGYAICDDLSNGLNRAGQSYVSQDVYTDPASGITWYEIFYNHRVAWAPASEVTVS